MDGKYKTVSLPADLVEKVEKALPAGSYSSIAEFVKEAIRLRLEATQSTE